MLRRVLRTLMRTLAAGLDDPAAIRRNVFVAGKLVPLQGTAEYLVVPRSSTSPRGARLEIPPKDLWEGYGTTAEDYLRCGADDVAEMVKLLSAGGLRIEAVSRVLDFGCAAGRMLRHVPHDREDLELWGVDIKAQPIAWCQQHFGPPFRFVTTTTTPHLPFEDNYFDLVYAGSVFTHIADLADAWLLELRRVLRPAGFAYITIHDRHTVELLRGRYRGRSDYAFLRQMIDELDAKTAVLSTDYAYFFIGREPGVQVFYDAAYLTQKWSRFMTVVSVTPEASAYQTALVLKK